MYSNIVTTISGTAITIYFRKGYIFLEFDYNYEGNCTIS